MTRSSAPLAAGLDHVVTGDPNRSADLTKVTVIYGTNGDDDGGTPVQAVEGIGYDLTAGIVNFADIVSRGARTNEVFYTGVVATDAGDGTVPLESSVGQFLNDPRVTLKPSTKGVKSHSVNYVPLMYNPDVQREVLAILGHAEATIETGRAGNQAEAINCAANGCVAVQTDPVEGFVVGGLGRRLGYTAATGPLTEIPGSFWSGDADGMGWILGDLVPPLTLQLTGLGGDYMAQVTTLSSEGAGGIEVRGTLAAGESRTVAVPLSVVADTTNPTAVLSAPATIGDGEDPPVSGADSTDIGGAIVHYEWTLDEFAPVVTTTPSFTFPAATYPLDDGDHTVSLVVVDDSGNRSSPDERRVTVTDATSRSGRDQFTIQVLAPSGATELLAAGEASWLAFLTGTNVPVVW